jgi:hypothetical protein
MRYSLSKVNLKRNFKGIIALTGFCILLFGIRYTDDWYGYLYFFNNPETSPDLLFKYLSIYFNNNGFSYVNLFQFHVLAIGFCLSYFITRFSSYPIFILFCFLLIRFIPITNQIRYYLAFGFFLMSVYFFLISNNRIKAFLLFILAGLSHIIIIPLFIIILIFPRVKKYTLKKLLHALIITSIIVLIIYELTLLLLTGHFSDYTQVRFATSIIGGFYLTLPILMVYIYIFNYFINITKKISVLKNDIKFKFLFILSVYSAPLLLLGFVNQIIVHRFVSIFSIVWFIYFIYPLSINPKDKQFILIRLFSLLLYLISVTYFIPIVFFGENDFIVKALLSLKSIGVI